jgi:hypothetical protein
MTAILIPEREAQNRIIPADHEPYPSSFPLHGNLLDIRGESG